MASPRGIRDRYRHSRHWGYRIRQEFLRYSFSFRSLEPPIRLLHCVRLLCSLGESIWGRPIVWKEMAACKGLRFSRDTHLTREIYVALLNGSRSSFAIRDKDPRQQERLVLEHRISNGVVARTLNAVVDPLR